LVGHDGAAPSSAVSVPMGEFIALREGRFVSLAPIARSDYPFLFKLVTDEECGPRWRFRGVIPREDAFERLLWEGVLTQFAVKDRLGSRPYGVVCAYGANLISGTAKVAVALQPEATGHGFGIEATYLFAAHLFSTWRLRKLYFETPEFNCAQFGSAIGRFLHTEGRLREDEFFGGRWWDTLILAMYPDDLGRLRQRYGTFFDASKGRQVSRRFQAWPTGGDARPEF